MTVIIRRGPSGQPEQVLTTGDTELIPAGNPGVVGAVLFWNGSDAWVAPMAVGPAAGEALVWDGASWTPSAIAAAVSSVFGRVGAVVAAASDYDASQVDNDAANAPGAFTSDALDAAWQQAVRNGTSGILSGGPFVAGAAADEVTVPDGTGTVTDWSDPANPVPAAVSWTGLTDIPITAIATTQITFLFISSGGSLVQISGTAPGPSDFRDQVFLGWVRHEDNATISEFVNAPALGYNASEDLNVVTRRSGPIVLSGMDVDANANLTFDVAAGTFWAKGSNFYADETNPSDSTFAAASPVSFARIYSDGVAGGETNFETASTTLIDPDNYDAAGTLTAVGSGNATIQEVRLDPAGALFLSYGQFEYSTLGDAIIAAGKEPRVNSAVMNLSSLVGFWCVAEGATDLTDPAQAQFISASGGLGAGGGGGGGSVVSSVFGRAGAVVAASSDYDLSQVDNDTATVPGSNAADAVDQAAVPLLSIRPIDWETPVNSDWAVNAFSPLDPDTTDPSMRVRKMTTGAENGVGYGFVVPAGVTSLRFRFKSRADVAPGATAGVQLVLYTRTFGDDSAPGAWSAGTNLTPISIPTNTNVQYDEQTLTLATLGLTAGTLCKIELTRDSAAGADTLTGSSLNLAHVDVWGIV